MAGNMSKCMFRYMTEDRLLSGNARCGAQNIDAYFAAGNDRVIGAVGAPGGVTEPLLVRPTWPLMRLAACAVEWVQQGGPLREKGVCLFTRTMQGQAAIASAGFVGGTPTKGRRPLPARTWRT